MRTPFATRNDPKLAMLSPRSAPDTRRRIIIKDPPTVVDTFTSEIYASSTLQETRS